MASQIGIDLAAVDQRVEAIKAARIANAFAPKMNEANLRNAEQQSQINAMQITQGQNAMADDATMRANGAGALAGDPNALNAIAAINPAKAKEFTDYVSSLDEKGRAAVLKSVDEAGKLANYVLTSPDPAAAYAEALTLLPKDIRAKAPAEYDEKWVKTQLGLAAALDAMNPTAGGVKAETTLGKLKADLDAGLITPEAYQAAVVKETAVNGGTQLSVDPATGAISFSQGGPAGSGKMPNLTEAQSKDLGFAARATGSLQTLDPVQGELTDFWGSTFSKVPFGNYAQTEDYQQADQAGREFLAALLRKDSGAAITPGEMDNYGKLYLPQPGDKTKVLEQKAAARERAVGALKAGIPAQAIRVAEENGIDLTVDLPKDDAAAGGEQVQARKSLGGKNYVQINGEWFEDDGTP